MLIAKPNYCSPISPAPGRNTPTVIDITPRLAAERRRIEIFIKEVYERAYGADISIDYPWLMSVQDEAGSILAAVGFRCADSRPLFLEQYTRESAEVTITRLYDETVPRTRIAEIGNLASAGGRGYTMFLFAALANCLLLHGITHVMVTVTEKLHQRFSRLGLHPRMVCQATADSLAGGSAGWGSYYETKPRVLAGKLAVAVDRLQAIHESVEEAPLPSDAANTADCLARS